MARSRNLSRREFTNAVMSFVGSIMGAVVGVPVITYLVSPAVKTHKSDAWIPLGALANYPAEVPTLFSFTRTKVNGWEKTVNSSSVYVLRGQGDEVKVLSTVCTHLSCRVTWDKESDRYACPCHDAHFSRDGSVLSGPPPRPLDRYESKIDNGNLFIHVVES